jgi:aminoglycoside phosphotransferase (APT) family kinase protein
MTVEALDPQAILAALGVQDVTSLERIPIGADTAIWRVEHDGVVSALRVFRPEQLVTSRREIAAMRAAATAGIPVPAVRGTTVWRNRPVELLSWCSGTTVLEAIMRHPWRICPLSIAFGRMQGRLHQATAGDELRTLSHSWIELAGPEEQALQDRIRQLPLRLDALLHLDFHPLNVMTDGRRITAVLDWANACAGDPRADVARTITIARLDSGPPGRWWSPLSLTRFFFELGYRIGYRWEAGRIGNLAPFYAWAGAFMIRDLTPRMGTPEAVLQPKDFGRMRRWTERWKARTLDTP